MNKKAYYLFILMTIWAHATWAQFNKNVVIAHRGAWKQQGFPENSLASLQQAIALGCHGSEFDVHLTKDDSLVVNHDLEFYGMDIENSTYEELMTKKHPNGEAIPTAEAYLRAGMKQKNTKLIFEIKSSKAGRARTLQLTRLAVDLVKRLKARKWVEYICFDYEVGKLIHQLDPKAQIAYLNGDIPPSQVKKDGYTGIDYHYNVFKEHPSWIQEAHDLGLRVNVWTVNEEAEMKNLLSQQVEYITTNEPELLFRVLEDKK